jgi:hypothetical protein
VYAATGPKTDAYTDYEDSIAVVLKYGNGAVASLHVAHHDPLRSFERSFSMSVVCERGGVAFDPTRDVVTHAPERPGGGRVVEERFPPHEESMYAPTRRSSPTSSKSCSTACRRVSPPPTDCDASRPWRRSRSRCGRAPRRRETDGGGECVTAAWGVRGQSLILAIR